MRYVIVVLAVAFLVIAVSAGPQDERVNTKKSAVDTMARLSAAKKELKNNPRSAHWHHQAALLYSEMKNNTEAFKEMDLALRYDSCNSFYLYTLALFKGEAGDAPGKEVALRKALALDPDNPALRYYLAVSLDDVGKRQEARKEYGECLASLRRHLRSHGTKEYLDARGTSFPILGLEEKVAQKLRTFDLKKN